MTFFSIKLHFIPVQYISDLALAVTGTICEDPKKGKIMKIQGLSMLAFHWSEEMALILNEFLLLGCEEEHDRKHHTNNHWTEAFGKMLNDFLI